MATKIQLRRDNAADWNITNPTLSEGEIGYETDTGKFKIGNGSSLWSALDYFLDSSDLSGYLTASSASTTYSTIASLNSGIVSASAAAVSYLIDSAPAALDTLNELAAAIADDANYASTITNALGNKLNISTASSTYLTKSSASTTYAPIIPTTQTGFRNVIINGDMRIDQRSNGAALTIPNAGGAYTYGTDRWFAYSTGGTGIMQQNLASGIYSTRITSVSTTNLTIGQRIEAQNSSYLAGQTVTLSFRMSSAVSPVTYAVAYANTTNTFGTQASPTITSITSGTVTTTGSFANYSITFAVPAAATTGLQITFTTPISSSNDLYLTNVQLELGSAATPFEQRPIGTELNLCQRYFYGPLGTGNNPLGTGLATNTNQVRVAVIFPVQLRVAPTLTFIAPTRIGYALFGDVQHVTATFYDSILSPFSASLVFTVSGTPLTIGQAVLYTTASGGAAQFSAEL